MDTLEPSSTVIEERLTKLFPTEMLEARARVHDVVVRDRKLDVTALVWALVFGFATGNNRAIEELRRTYLKFANHYLCPSSFHDRLTGALAVLLRDLIDEAMAEMPTPHTMTDSIDHIHSVVIADADTDLEWLR